MNIAVYSGSFNPLHIGHLAIIRYMMEEGGFDKVYLIVSPKNPLKDGISSASGYERLQAAREAVQRHFANDDKVYVDDIEMNMPEPHYTIRTLHALQEREPGNRFTFIMGADNLGDIRRWKDYSGILCDFGVAVYPRDGFDLDQIKADLQKENPHFKIRTVNAPKVAISSSEIRDGMATGKDMSEYLM